MEQRAREGDFIETVEGLIFDVKGLIHPPERFIAYLRYYPDINGERIRQGIRYEKIYALENRFEFLEKKFPQYLFYDKTCGETLQGIPIENIKKIYHPTNFLGELLGKNEEDLQNSAPLPLQKAFKLVSLIQIRAGIKYRNIGISGSLLVNLETAESDIDLIIYGSKSAYLVREALSELYTTDYKRIQPYSEKTLQDLYKLRGRESGISFQDFVKIEQRKKLQGRFKGTDYYIRCIKDWEEIQYKYGEITYKPLGFATIKGIISNDTESIFTPCKYSLESSKIINGFKPQVQIQEIVSYRGRFCEQAGKGEAVEAQGKVESVNFNNKIYYRLLLGAYKEDYMKLLNI